MCSSVPSRVTTCRVARNAQRRAVDDRVAEAAPFLPVEDRRHAPPVERVAAHAARVPAELLLPVREGDAADALREELRLRGSGLWWRRRSPGESSAPPLRRCSGRRRRRAARGRARAQRPRPSRARRRLEPRRGARAGRRSAAMRRAESSGASTDAPALRTSASARSCSASSAARSGDARERRFDLRPPPGVERSVRKRSELDGRVVGWVGMSPVPLARTPRCQ